MQELLIMNKYSFIIYILVHICDYNSFCYMNLSILVFSEKYLHVRV